MSHESLARQLEQVAERFITFIESIEPAAWDRQGTPDEWAPSKDAEHVLEATVMHQWVVRRSLGHKTTSTRPPVERAHMTACMPQHHLVQRLRDCTQEGIELISGLTPEQLQTPVKSASAKKRTVQNFIEGPLIGHFETHRMEIAKKLKTATKR
jgi:hypothetical protein